MQEDTQNAASSGSFPKYTNHELKRKAKLETAAEINRELSVRKKAKVSVVPAVNLYE
jgi:hypothetical protein